MAAVNDTFAEWHQDIKSSVELVAMRIIYLSARQI